MGNSRSHMTSTKNAYSPRQIRSVIGKRQRHGNARDQAQVWINESAQPSRVRVHHDRKDMRLVLGQLTSGSFHGASFSILAQMLPRGLRVPQLVQRAERSSLSDATLLITHAEVCSRHGVGALLMKIFDAEPALLVLYSHSYFDGECAGDLALHLPLQEAEPASVRAMVARVLETHTVGRIFCVPHFAEDVLCALTAVELTGAPLVTYVMDDQNVFFPGIPDHLIRRLVDRSSLRLAISEALKDAYAEKFGQPFGFLPPVNAEGLFAAPGFRGPAHHPPRGVVIGNVWSRRVLEGVQRVVETADIKIDWYGNLGRPLFEPDEVELANSGINLHPNLSDERLVPELRGFDYGIMPSGQLNEDPQQDWLFRGSLPSRLVYMLTSAHLPLVVLGDADTAAGDFVRRLGLGVVCPYEPREFMDAVRRVTIQPAQQAIRDQAEKLSPSFASGPVSEWVWRSAALGRPADDRYERLLEPQQPGLSI